MNRVELKAKAKEQIKGNIGVLFLMYLVIAAIATLVNIIPGVGALADVVVISPLASLVMIMTYLNLAKGIKPELAMLFQHLNKFWGAFKVQFLSGLYIMLWSLLLVIPGIVKAYSYSMAMYILAENPEMGAREAISLSKKMMNGHKMELFVLELSFIGWILLSIITFGIATIWAIPYISAATANFYNNIKNNPIVE